MKHSVAPVRRIPVLSTTADIAAAVIYVAWEVLDDFAGWLSRSRAAAVIGKTVAVLAAVVVLALLSGCHTPDARPDSYAAAVQR